MVFELLISIITPLYAVPLIAQIYSLSWVKFVTNNHLGRIVKESLNLILPCILVGLVVLSVNATIILMIESSQILTLFEIDYRSSPIEFGAIFAW
ncbi:EAL domain [Vibrio ponticus]|nr:EAL domain [Vibrio ponticus]